MLNTRMSNTARQNEGGPAALERSGLLAMGHGDVNLAGVDLNLLVALDALLRTSNVTHAGHQVGLSQPAMSRALARLRAMFRDDLLVRTSKGLVPTRRADQLAEALPPILHQLRDMIGMRSVPPHEWQTRITVAMPDHQALVLLPRLLPRLRERAPNLDLVADPCLTGALKRLEQGEIDFAVGQIGDAPSGIYLKKLYSDRFVGLLRRGHPALSAPLTTDGFAGMRHAAVSSGAEDGRRHIHDCLAQLEWADRMPVMVPNVMTACMMVSEVDLMLTLPQRVAQRAAAMLPLVVVELPFQPAAYEVSLIWHERRHRDPEHRWMRAEMTAASLAAI